MCLFNEVADHHFGHFKISDDPIFHRTNGTDVPRCLTDHVLGFLTYGKDTLLSVFVILNGNDGRFIDTDALSLNKYQCIGGTKVDCKVIGENTQKFFKHDHSSFCYADFLSLI